MTLLVDTSAWIETLIGSALGKIIARELPAEADWLMPTIVQHEVAKWLRREGKDEGEPPGLTPSSARTQPQAR